MDLTDRTEQILALEASLLASNFNFESRKLNDNIDVKTAQALYREIFYTKAFYRVKSRNFSFNFESNFYAKSGSCSKCLKKIMEQLKSFADWVLDEKE